MSRQTGELWALVQAWMDSMPYGASERQLANRIDIPKSTLSTWKYREGWPHPDALRRLAAEIGVPYEKVLDAVLKDRGYRRPSSARRETEGTA